MKRLLFSIIFLLFLGCEEKEVPLADHPGAQIYHGKARVDVRCYRCHGPLGEGSSRAPSLIKAGKTIPSPLFIETVMNGRDRMPGFASVLSEKEIESIIDWLQKIHANGNH